MVLLFVLVNVLLILGGLIVWFMGTLFDERGDRPFRWTFNIVGAIFIGLSVRNFWGMLF